MPALFRLLPEALVLQPVGDFLRHIILVMLGQNAVGHETVGGGIKNAFRHHALPLTEKIGQDAGIADRHVCFTVRHGKAHRTALATLDRAFRHQTAKADAGAGIDWRLLQIGRHVEIGDGLAEGEHDEQHRRDDEAHAAADDCEPFLFAGHCVTPCGIARPCPSMRTGPAETPNSFASARSCLPSSPSGGKTCKPALNASPAFAALFNTE